MTKTKLFRTVLGALRRGQTANDRVNYLAVRQALSAAGISRTNTPELWLRGLAIATSRLATRNRRKVFAALTLRPATTTPPSNTERQPPFNCHNPKADRKLLSSNQGEVD